MTSGLTIIACISIGTAFACAIFIALDETKHPQSMGVMNIVWPVTALYFSVVAVWAYFALGRRHTREAMRHKMQHPQGKSQGGGQGSGQKKDQGEQKPKPSQVAVGTSHCGAGCMIADIASELTLAATGFVILGSTLYTSYIIDFACAWALGIVFQYFAIKPMRDDLSPGGAIAAAIKADTLSILAFQTGMYAFMALVYFKLFTSPHLTALDPRFWLMMQAAMVCGFATSYPMNRLLIGMGWKEAM